LTPRRNRRWILSKLIDGRVDASNFEWVESPVPAPADGEMLVLNLWLSLDPTQVLHANGATGPLSTAVGQPMHCTGASRVLESRLPGFASGDLVRGWSGWEEYSILKRSGEAPEDLPPEKLPPDMPPNLALGTYGATGMAAYFGVVDVAQPKAGETFVVDSAAGGVGSIAGQIARVLGCRVIGLASGTTRRDWLVRALRFDGAIDPGSEDLEARLTALCPHGIDIFFFNSGRIGVLDAALAQLRRSGRVVLCGGTSYYLAKEAPPGPKNLLSLIMQEGRMEGVLHWEHKARFGEARDALGSWIRSGQLTSAEDVLAGLERAPEALARVFQGVNAGKQLLRLDDRT